MAKGQLMSLRRASGETIWINGRFLGRPISGVERVARELVGHLSKRLNAAGEWITPGGTRVQFILIAPRKSGCVSAWKNLPIRHLGIGTGHAWEQFALPGLSRGGWVLSLCNTGPIVKRKQIIFLHDAQPFALPKAFRTGIRCWYKILYRVVGWMSRAVLTNSGFSASELVRFTGINPSKITRLELGSEHARGDQDEASLLAKWPELGKIWQTRFILAPASGNLNKNTGAVGEALALMGEDVPPCVMFGQANTRVLATTSCGSINIINLGRVSDSELRALYRRALCLVFPSVYEGFGLPPLEAMANECPVVVSNTGALPETCGDAALYCDPADASTLACSIQRLRSEPNLRETLVQRGLERAVVFSWERGVDGLLETVARCVQPSRREKDSW